MRIIGEALKREIDGLATSGIIKKQDDKRVVQLRKYRVITLLFGGGVKAGQNDESKLIRETSIRGQLRFWWRALRGSGSIEEIKSREDEIFGNGGKNAKQSCVSVKVRVTESGKQQEVFQIGRTKKGKIKYDPVAGYDEIAYAAFALRPEEENIQPGKVRKGVEFELEISFPESLREDVEAALWAWETFGGVGGRTRRGFGAIELLSLEENGQKKELKKYRVENAETQIKEELKKHLLPNKRCPREIPHLLENSVLCVRSFEKNSSRNSEKKNPDKNSVTDAQVNESAMWAWKQAIRKLRDFRQYRLDKRTRQESKYGKSQWPEPDEIRRLCNVIKQSTVQKFPRAVFGLPIIFHFPQEKGAVPDATLELIFKEEDAKRLASPLILRPISCENGAVALALILEATRAFEFEKEFGKSLVLTLKLDGKLHKAKAKLEPDEAEKLTRLGLNVLQNETDVLEAFIKYFKK